MAKEISAVFFLLFPPEGVNTKMLDAFLLFEPKGVNSTKGKKLDGKLQALLFFLLYAA